MSTRNRRTRTLADGREITVTINRNVSKRCDCSRRKWGTCPHPWWFNYKPRGEGTLHHRFALTKYAALFPGNDLKTREQAERAATLLRAMLDNGGFPPVAEPKPATPSDQPFSEVAELWLTRAREPLQVRDDLSENQVKNDRGIMRRLARAELKPGLLLGSKPVGALTVDDWETAFAQLPTTFAGSTRNKYRQGVRSLQSWCLDKGYLVKPWLTEKQLDTGILAHQKGARRDRRLHPDIVDETGRLVEPGEEKRLLEHAGPYLKNLIIAAIETCSREGELLSLTWADVDLAGGLLTFRQEKTKDEDMRQIPISDRLRGVLEFLHTDPLGRPHPPSAYPFGDGLARRVRFPRKAWETCVLKAHGHKPRWRNGGLAPESRAQFDAIDLEFRDLRHEGGCRLSDRGWSLPDVSLMLGHADAKTTSIYLHSSVQALQDSMHRFGNAPRSHLLHTLTHAPVSEPSSAIEPETAKGSQTPVN